MFSYVFSCLCIDLIRDKCNDYPICYILGNIPNGERRIKKEAASTEIETASQEMIGVDDGTRTHDRRNHNPLLYH